MFVVICFIVAGISLLLWAWFKSFNHFEELKSESDFLNSAGRDGWDDNAINVEGDF
jgi:hypothetical protein